MKIMTMIFQNMKIILMKIMTMTTKIMMIMMMTKTTMMKTMIMIMTTMKMITMTEAAAEEVQEAETSSVTAREDLLPVEADREAVPVPDPDQAEEADRHQVQATELQEEVSHP